MAPHVTDPVAVLPPASPLVSRLSLEPALGRRGVLDGGWWPRSRSASIELPSLVSLLNARVGQIVRLGVDARDWDDIPRRITVGGHSVRIGRFDDLDHKIIVACGRQDHILLLAIPPHASTAAAKSALAMASIGTYSSTPEEILVASGIDNETVGKTPRVALNDDRRPLAWGCDSTAPESGRPIVIENALRDQRDEIGRWFDDGAPPTPSRRGTRTDPRAKDGRPTHPRQAQRGRLPTGGPGPRKSCGGVEDRVTQNNDQPVTAGSTAAALGTEPLAPHLLDGAWYPRSADPITELPGLIQTLQGPGPPGDHGPVTHILLGASDWNSRPRLLRIDGMEGLTDTRLVRLSWFDTLPAGQLIVIYADGHRVDLLTIPAYADGNTVSPRPTVGADHDQTQ